MNYLQLVNAVLRRLRESEVSTVQGTGNNNSYARLIGDYVNEAKAQVEDAWQWTYLKQELTVTTANGTSEYTITGSGNKFSINMAYNDTADSELTEMPIEEWIALNNLSAPISGDVEQYAFAGKDSVSEDIKIKVYPVPNSIQTLKFFGTVRGGNLSADTDTLLLPDRPVILLATAMAMEERGEDNGQQSVYAYQVAKSALADEIAIDASRQPHLTTWYET